MSQPSILLTNDDGIDAPGIAALYKSLSAVGDVCVIAPHENRSGVGRTRNGRVQLSDHPWGYQLSGTPADCVAFGLGSDQTPDVDLVVSGINDGPNIGNYVLGRSGTVGAGVEATLLGTPAIAVSGYHTEDYHCSPASAYDFDGPATVTKQLIERIETAEIDLGDVVLNVNVPVDRLPYPVRLTELEADYGQRVEDAGDNPSHRKWSNQVTEPNGGALNQRAVDLIDQTWPHVDGYENPLADGSTVADRYPASSDRRALIDGDTSLTPLSLGVSETEVPGLASLVDELSRP